MKPDQQLAVGAYILASKRRYYPTHYTVEVAVDKLRDTLYQKAWTTAEEYIKDRCVYDPETNEELLYYVTENWADTEFPPIYIDLLPDGVALVDGVHRLTAAFLLGRPTIKAHTNALGYLAAN